MVLASSIVTKTHRIPVENANIFVSDTNGKNLGVGTISDNEGYFNFIPPLWATHVTISHIGYVNQTIPLENYSFGQLILLEVDYNQLPGVTITANSGNTKKWLGRNWGYVAASLGAALLLATNLDQKQLAETVNKKKNGA